MPPLNFQGMTGVTKEQMAAMLAGKLTKGTEFDAEAMAKILKEKVIGQDKVADQITAQIEQGLGQAKHTTEKIEKPIGVFMLAGPPGTGKTYFCKVLAENMYDKKGGLLHYDMTQFSQAHTKSSLIGAAQGYGGPGSLTKALEENPKAIVLFDEFEKAHDDIQKAFLTAWNDGFIIDANTQKRVSTTKAIFMLTTNAAMERLVEIEREFKDGQPGRVKAMRETLKQAGYAAEVLSRIDHIFVFDELTPEGMAQLSAIEIQRLASRYGLKVAKIDEDYIVDLVSQEEAFEGGGARELARVLTRQLGPQFLDAKDDGARRVWISMVNGEVVVRALKEK